MTIPLPAQGSTAWYQWAGDVTNRVNTSGPVTVESLPAGVTLTVQKTGGVWPARPTARGDIFVQWKGPDPAPAVVTSGTGGMRSGVDWRLVE